MQTHKLRKSLPVLVGVTSALLVGALVAVGQTVPPRMIPYEGHLDQNGVPVTGEVAMTFYLVDAANKTYTQKLWEHKVDMVQILAGRFAVGLPIPDNLLQQPELYIGVVVAGADLAGKQRLLSAPSAITAAQAKDFTVSGNLGVNGNVTVNGRGRVSNINLTPGWSDGGTATSSEIANDTGTYKALMLVGNSASGTRSVGVWDHLHVHGSMKVDGRVTIGRTHNGTLTENGFWGDWNANQWCPEGTYVCGMRTRVEGNQGGGDDTAMNGIQLYCCTLGP